MSAQIIRTIVFIQIIAFNSYLDNLGKALNSTFMLVCYTNLAEPLQICHFRQAIEHRECTHHFYIPDACLL